MVTLTCLKTQCCLPATDVGDDGALEIILKDNHYGHLLICLNIKIWNKIRLYTSPNHYGILKYT